MYLSVQHCKADVVDSSSQIQRHHSGTMLSTSISASSSPLSESSAIRDGAALLMPAPLSALPVCTGRFLAVLAAFRRAASNPWAAGRFPSAMDAQLQRYWTTASGSVANMGCGVPQ